MAGGLACPDGAVRVAASQACTDTVPSLYALQPPDGVPASERGAAILGDGSILVPLLQGVVGGVALSARGDARLRYFELLHALTSAAPTDALVSAAPRLLGEMKRLWEACKG